MTVLDISTEVATWLIPAVVTFLAIQTKRMTATIVSFFLLAFSLIYLVYSTGSFIYILSAVVSLAVAITLIFEMLERG